jgi:hypothetical protein
MAGTFRVLVMTNMGGYFLALLGTAVLGSLLNILFWYIEVQILPIHGFNFGIDFFVFAFFISTFISFFVALPAFGIAWFFEQRRSFKRRSLLHTIIYLIYLLIAVLLLGMRDWEALVGGHLYLLSGIFCAYMFIWRHELKKESGLLDD